MNNNKIINEEILTLLREYTHENEDGVEDPYEEYKEMEKKCQEILNKNNITINEPIPTITNYPIVPGLLDKLVITLSSGVTGDTPDIILYQYKKLANSMDRYDETITIKTTNICGVYIYIEDIFDAEIWSETRKIKLINDFDYKFYTE